MHYWSKKHRTILPTVNNHIAIALAGKNINPAYNCEGNKIGIICIGLSEFRHFINLKTIQQIDRMPQSYLSLGTAERLRGISGRRPLWF
jgi:hypothetical protein